MAGENRIQKEKIVAEIKEKLSRAKCIVLVDYNKITVEKVTRLRKELRESQIDYKVYKNRLVQRVMTELGYGDINEQLQDTVALAISYDDVVAPCRIITTFAKTNACPTIKAGVVEGKIMDKAAMETLAKIPPKEVLIAQLLGLLVSPIRNLAVVLSEIAKSKGTN